ncbi:snoRNA-binding rRNA-processing protein [Taxawa tesnikishii (nom. ined.)]|nr:snoRNA-binding rRNA-processing protein [Dothideales sp. JES 119]
MGRIRHPPSTSLYQHLSMPKATTPKSRDDRRHNPLAEEYQPTLPQKQKLGKRKKSHADGEGEENYVDSKSSRRILQIGQDLAAEEEAENAALRPQQPNPAFDFESRFGNGALSDDEEEKTYDDDDAAWGDEEEEIIEEVEVDPNDLTMFNRFNPEFDPSTLLAPKSAEEEAEGESTNLADLILAKIAEHEATQDGRARDIDGDGRPEGVPEDAIELPAKVVEVYTQVGTILSRYKSGKLPKPFKILPTLPQWDTLLSITRPDSWTPNAYYEATKLFTSSRPALAQAFCTTSFSPRARGHLRNQEIECALVQGSQEGAVQARGFLQGPAVPTRQQRDVHTTRSAYHQLRACSR